MELSFPFTVIPDQIPTLAVVGPAFALETQIKAAAGSRAWQICVPRY